MPLTSKSLDARPWFSMFPGKHGLCGQCYEVSWRGRKSGRAVPRRSDCGCGGNVCLGSGVRTSGAQDQDEPASDHAGVSVIYTVFTMH